MARVNVPILDAAKNLAAGLDLTAGSVAADVTEDHKLLNRTSRVILFVWTAAASGVDISFDSIADPFGREGDASEEGPTTIAASKFFAFGPFSPGLFTQKTGTYVNYLQVNLANLSGTVKLVAISVP